MIKKINTLLVVAFVAMLALKGVKVLKDSRAAAAQSHKAATSERQDASQLAPCVCYGYWAGYSIENPISNRNGVLLDMMRAIFPNATFRNVHGNVDEFAKILREDPKAVVVGFGEHPSLKGMKMAPTPLMHCPLVLMTLRTNPWRVEILGQVAAQPRGGTAGILHHCVPEETCGKPQVQFLTAQKQLAFLLHKADARHGQHHDDA